MYTDPDGECPILVGILIGAALGAYSGYKIGEAAGAKGWKMAGYIAGGALIGGLSGAATGGIAVGGGGPMLSGMVGGAINGAGFNGLASGGDINSIFEGAFKGALTGLVSSGVNSSIGGSWGAIAGGAIGSGMATYMNGGSIQDIGKSMLTGGVMSYGIYQGASYVNWKWGGGNKIGDVNVGFRQFKTIQADYQRSRFYGKEYGGYLKSDGTVQRSGRGNSSLVNLGKKPDDAFAEYHIHWDKPGAVRYCDAQGDYVDPQYIAENTDVGKKIMVTKIKVAQYHSSMDFNTGGQKSIVINRYDGSYYSGTGNNYSIINPPIQRFHYSYFNW